MSTAGTPDKRSKANLTKSKASLTSQTNIKTPSKSKAGSVKSSVQNIAALDAPEAASNASEKKDTPEEEIIPAAAPDLLILPINTAYYHDWTLEDTEIHPLFLSTQSQTITKCIIGEDVTEEKMFRMVPKSDLMQDMATRLAISDFTPAKAKILVKFLFL